MVGGIWMTNLFGMNYEAKKFFEEKLKEKWPNRPLFRNSGFCKFSESDACFLKEGFTVKEIKTAVWPCGGDKSPGPDGFTFNFFKKYWEQLKDDVMGLVKFFEGGGKLSRGCKSSFISLAANSKDPIHFGDHTPISLIGSLYKIIAKLLALRL